MAQDRYSSVSSVDIGSQGMGVGELVGVGCFRFMPLSKPSSSLAMERRAESKEESVAVRGALLDESALASAGGSAMPGGLVYHWRGKRGEWRRWSHRLHCERRPAV
jgi:hypothetical protein